MACEDVAAVVAEKGDFGERANMAGAVVTATVDGTTRTPKNESRLDGGRPNENVDVTVDAPNCRTTITRQAPTNSPAR